MFRMHLLGVQEGDSMSYMDTYRQWCENPYFDESVREELKSIAGNEKEIEDRFYKDLKLEPVVSEELSDTVLTE